MPVVSGDEYMIRYNLTEFFKLSAALNYQLSVSGDFGWNILRIIIGDMKLSREQQNILLDALSYLNHAYKDQHRRLGPNVRDSSPARHCHSFPDRRKSRYA